MCHVSVIAATLKEIGQFVVNTNTEVGKGGFCQSRDLAGVFYLGESLGFGSLMEPQALFKGRVV